VSVAFRLSLFYAAAFLVAGVQLPFWPVWLAGRGLDAGEIGAVLAIGQWIKVAANPLAGMLADRCGNRRRVMLPLAMLSAVGYLLCLPQQGFASLLFITALIAASSAGILPLADTITLAGKGMDYGRVRLWGTFAFILATLLGGRILTGRSPETVLYLLLGATILMTLACTLVPPAAITARGPCGSAWRHLLAPRHLVFLAAATLIQGSHGVYYAFGTLYWRSLGFASGTIAWLWAEGAIAEMVLFYCGRRLLDRLGPFGLLTLGGAAGILRWTATALTADLAVLIVMQLLHAFTFGAAHLGAMHYLARGLPAEHAATGQAFYSAIVGGIGFGLITLGSGTLYGAVGGGAYYAMALAAAAGAVSAGLLAATR